jgi:hypothetical protein
MVRRFEKNCRRYQEPFCFPSTLLKIGYGVFKLGNFAGLTVVE